MNVQVRLSSGRVLNFVVNADETVAEAIVRLKLLKAGELVREVFDISSGSEVPITINTRATSNVADVIGQADPNAPGSFPSIEEDFDVPTAIEAAGGFLGRRTQGLNLRQRFIRRNLDPIERIFGISQRFGLNNVPGFSPSASIGQFVEGAQPGDIRGQARDILQANVGLSPEQRGLNETNFESGNLPALLRQGTFGRLSPQAQDFLVSQLGPESIAFRQGRFDQGLPAEGGDFFGGLVDKFNLRRFF